MLIYNNHAQSDESWLCAYMKLCGAVCIFLTSVGLVADDDSDRGHRSSNAGEPFSATYLFLWSSLFAGIKAGDGGEAHWAKRRDVDSFKGDWKVQDVHTRGAVTTLYNHVLSLLVVRRKLRPSLSVFQRLTSFRASTHLTSTQTAQWICAVEKIKFTWVIIP